MASLSLTIWPLVGVGDMRFGQSRREIHSLMGSPTEMFRRVAWSRNLTDRYDQWWLTLDYSDSGSLDFVEIAAGRCTVTFDGVQLLPGLALDVADQLRDGGFTTSATDSGLSIVGAGIKLYIPSTERDAAVEAVSAAASGNLGELDASFFGEPGGSKIEAWPVDAHRGIAGIRLGQMRSEVRQRMGEGMHSAVSATRSMDHYWAEGMVAMFDADDRVVDVIALAPAKPAVGGIEVLGRSYDGLRDALTAAGYSIEEKPAELYVAELGASVWWSRDSEEPLPSVAVALEAGLPA